MSVCHVDFLFSIVFCFFVGLRYCVSCIFVSLCWFLVCFPCFYSIYSPLTSHLNFFSSRLLSSSDLLRSSFSSLKALLSSCFRAAIGPRCQGMIVLSQHIEPNMHECYCSIGVKNASRLTCWVVLSQHKHD